MNIKEVKDLIQDILQSDISEFELEHTGTKVKLRRGSQHVEALAAQALPSNPGPAPAGNAMMRPAVAVAQTPAVLQTDPGVDQNLHIIASPIVGTFYRSPAPNAEPFVKIGAKIDIGSILCIVEAMKLMNEIPSDVSGEVVEIFVENGHPVEYGQKLFGIRIRA